MYFTILHTTIIKPPPPLYYWVSLLVRFSTPYLNNYQDVKDALACHSAIFMDNIPTNRAVLGNDSCIFGEDAKTIRQAHAQLGIALAR